MKSLQVLILEDNDSDLELILVYLRQAGFEPILRHATDEAEFIAMLDSEPDLILADYYLPQFDGGQALHLAKERWPDIPFVLLTGVVPEAIVDQLLKEGADDYLLKDRLTRLGSAVDQALSRQVMKHKQAETEARFQMTFEQAAVGLAHMDLTGQFLRVNQKLCDIVGYTRLELLNLTVGMLTHSDDLAESAGQIQALLAGETVSPHLAHRMLHQSGRTLWINKTISVARNWADKPDYLICVIEDITERQQLRQQLHHAQKMEAVGRLSASIAHDFNNLLTAIRGFGELALVKFGDHPAADDLAEVVQATQRASDLTRRLLGFSRMSVIQPHVLDLNTVLAQLESLLRRLLASNIELTFWLADDLWPVKADISELEQILVNLAINAGDAMPSGGQLLIGTTNMASESTVRLTVTDTGHGMTDEVLARLFEPFFTTKAMGKGTGLGLSTVHDIVTASGGQIMVTSALGQGTTFQIDLPRADQPALIPAAAGEVEATTTESSVVYPRTVLIAEDETSIQLMMERYLSRFGYQILSANDGLEALQIGREHDGPIDLLLTDMSMAGLTGDQLARQLTTCLPNLKVLYITGSPDRIKPDMLNGKADFLLKPFDIDNLAAKVQTLLEPMKANHLKLGLERKHSF